MDLSIYDVIKGISVTSKSRALFDDLGKITFEVNPFSNKVMIRFAVEKIWKVKVRDVRIINVKGKKKSFAKKKFITPDKKKAIITLKEGYKIDLPGQFETMGVSSGAEAKKDK
jgi:large subunit ribosomal protein L23